MTTAIVANCILISVGEGSEIIEVDESFESLLSLRETDEDEYIQDDHQEACPTKHLYSCPSSRAAALQLAEAHSGREVGIARVKQPLPSKHSTQPDLPRSLH